MKQYTADRQAQRTLQIAVPLAAAIILFLIWYFLPFLPEWLLWCITFLLIAAAIFVAAIFLPLWFGTVIYTISDTHITKRCGIFFIQEQTMRTQALQYSTIVRAPFSEKNGLNFIPLHAYGGTIFLAFLRTQDALEIERFLQKTVYRHGETSSVPDPSESASEAASQPDADSAVQSE